MARELQRAAEPHHLNAATVPVERALLARAKAIDEAYNGDIRDMSPQAEAARAVGAEFSALAAELHFW